MKNLALIFAFLLSTAYLSAQNFLKVEDVNVENVSKGLEKKGFKIIKKDKSSILIENNRKDKMFVDFDEEKKYILFNVGYQFSADATEEQIQALIYKVNNLKMIKLIRDEREKKGGIFMYYFWTAGGFFWETLDNALDEFAFYVEAVHFSDKDKVFNTKK